MRARCSYAVIVRGILRRRAVPRKRKCTNFRIPPASGLEEGVVPWSPVIPVEMVPIRTGGDMDTADQGVIDFVHNLALLNPCASQGGCP